MTTSLAANATQAYQAYTPDFKPSYNAVQLNLSQPTLNVPQAQTAFPTQNNAVQGQKLDLQA